MARSEAEISTYSRRGEELFWDMHIFEIYYLLKC